MAQSASDKALQAKLANAESLVKQCEEFEEELARLRAIYDQYFLGLERHPPSQAHGELKKRLHKLKTSFTRQTEMRFRIQALANKYLAYERLWDRTLREIESGTYHRDVFKAKFRARAQPDKPPPAEIMAKASEVPPAPTQKPPSAPPVSEGGLTPEKLRLVYDAYVAAKRQRNEDVSKITFDSIASRLRAQVPQLLQQHQARSIDFKVIIKDGKVILRAIPK